MPLIKSFRGVVIEKNPKTFKDGSGGGFFVTVVIEDGSLVSFWADTKFDNDLGDSFEVEGYDRDFSRLFVISVREFDGKTKKKLVSVAD